MLNEIYEFLCQCETYYLATIEDNKPKVRPFGTVDLFENRLYIQTGKIKDVSKQIKKNPYVELCAYASGKWLRLSGRLVEDSRYEAKAHMLDKYENLKGMYSADDDNTEVLYFTEATAIFSSFTEKPRIFNF